MLRLSALLYFFTCPLVVFSQQHTPQNQHILEKHSYQSLQELLDDTDSDTQARTYADSYILKAKRESNPEALVQGYKNRLHLEEEFSARLQYADSMVGTGQKLDCLSLAAAYTTKGSVYYSAKKLIPALDAYLRAEALLEGNTASPPYLKNRFCIAQVKYYLGYYTEAIALLEPIRVTFARHEPRGYLNVLHLLGLCHNRLGNYARCTTYNKEGMALAAKAGESPMLAYFLHSDGVNEFFLKNYSQALKHLGSTMVFLKSREDYANMAVAHYYMGRAHEALGAKAEAMLQYQQVCTLSDTMSYIRPDILPAYEKLIENAHRRNDLAAELHYTRALRRADSILNADYRYLSRRLSKEYDTKKLSKSIQALETALARGKKQVTSYHWLSIAIACSTMVLVVYMLWYRKKKYTPQGTAATQQPKAKRTARLKPEVKEGLLKGLEKFEREKIYLQKDMNLNKMAKKLGTNPRYVSMLIHEERVKTTPDYINALRIHHLMALLETNKAVRTYTYKDLAKDIGYSTTNSLHKAFQQYAGMPLPEYIDGLKSQGVVMYYEGGTSPIPAASGTHG